MPHNRTRKNIAAPVALLFAASLSGCLGGGGDSEDSSASPTLPSSAKFSGTLTRQQASQGTAVVELVAANGTARTAPVSAQGQFEFSTEGLEAPLLLRARGQSGELAYAASTSLPGANGIVNINPLTQLAAATISPEGNPTKLWDMPAAERAARIRTSHGAIAAQVAQAVAPVVTALQLPASTDFAHQAATGNGNPVSTLLESLQIENHPLTGTAIFSVAAARTPSLRSIWQANDSSIPAVPLSPQYPPTAVAPALAKIEASYAATRQGAAQFDPAKMNQAEVMRLVQEMQNMAANPNFTMSQLNGLYKSFLLAMGFPATFADEIVRQMNGANPTESLETMLSFFGPEGQRALQEMSNMQATLVSVDQPSQLATYQIVVGGQTYYQTVSLSTGNSVTGRTAQRDYAQQCIRTRYVGPSGPSQRISPEQFVENQEAYNACNFEIQYASCIWQGGTTGTQNSGCTGNTSTGTALPQESTYLREVRSGPLYQQRAFVACKSPAKPVFQGNASDPGVLPAFTLLWQCKG